ncbi:hypothetical protein SDC9_169724 [bioreactor metagenome]|uniref:Uncharacterized protein n=1 Tax=bioreactor metagenome TaxID=1076179 RepID=A0A645G638_9ZZZZ
MRNISLIDQIIEQEEYQNAREMFKHFVGDLLEDEDQAIIHLQNEGLISKDKNRQIVKYFLDINIMFFTDMFKFRQSEIAWYNSQLTKIRQSKFNKREILNVLLKCRDTLSSNANLALLMDQMFYQIQEVSNGR